MVELLREYRTPPRLAVFSPTLQALPRPRVGGRACLPSNPRPHPPQKPHGRLLEGPAEPPGWARFARRPRSPPASDIAVADAGRPEPPAEGRGPAGARRGGPGPARGGPGEGEGGPGVWG